MNRYTPQNAPENCLKTPQNAIFESDAVLRIFFRQVPLMNKGSGANFRKIVSTDPCSCPETTPFIEIPDRMDKRRSGFRARKGTKKPRERQKGIRGRDAALSQTSVPFVAQSLRPAQPGRLRRRSLWHVMLTFAIASQRPLLRNTGCINAPCISCPPRYTLRVAPSAALDRKIGRKYG